MANNYFAHQQLVKEFSLLINAELPQMRVFDRTVGVFYAKRVNNGVIDYQAVTINKPGMADMYGIVKTKFGFAVHLEFEFKTGKGKQTKDQLNWENFINNFMNGKYIVVRNAQDAIDEIKTYLNARGLL
jgi:hypothetical protein